MLTGEVNGKLMVTFSLDNLLSPVVAFWMRVALDKLALVVNCVVSLAIAVSSVELDMIDLLVIDDCIDAEVISTDCDGLVGFVVIFTSTELLLDPEFIELLNCIVFSFRTPPPLVDRVG